MPGNVSMLTSVGTTATCRCASSGSRSGVSPVPCSTPSSAGGEQVGQALLAEAVRGHLGAGLVRGGDRLDQHVRRPAGREVAGVAVDPVADELDPAVAAGGLPAHLGDEVLRLDLGAEAAQVAPGPGDVPPGADQPRQVLAVVDPPGVGGGAGVAQQQRAGVAVGAGLLLGGGASTSPAAPSPTWQCASTRPGTTQPGSAVTSPAGRVSVSLPPTTHAWSTTSSGPTSRGPVRCSAVTGAACQVPDEQVPVGSVSCGRG